MIVNNNALVPANVLAHANANADAVRAAHLALSQMELMDELLNSLPVFVAGFVPVFDATNPHGFGVPEDDDAGQPPFLLNCEFNEFLSYLVQWVAYLLRTYDDATRRVLGQFALDVFNKVDRRVSDLPIDLQDIAEKADTWDVIIWQRLWNELLDPAKQLIRVTLLA